MTTAFHPDLGYIRSGRKITIHGTTYPENFLDKASTVELAALGIKPCPKYDAAHDVLEQDPVEGWTVRPKTKAENDANAAAIAAARDEEIARNSVDVAHIAPATEDLKSITITLNALLEALKAKQSLGLEREG